MTEYGNEEEIRNDEAIFSNQVNANEMYTDIVRKIMVNPELSSNKGEVEKKYFAAQC